ncbi:hypothetical protein VTO42DRAFT_6949 [Malbranchea cinnamomea]
MTSLLGVMLLAASLFPGPKLAAATFWYEFYYDAILKGKYAFKIRELHKKYGPIVRISPCELHIADPDYYTELYSHRNPKDKNPYYLEPFAFPLSSFATCDHRLHRLRRGAMNPFFSRGRVLKHEALIQQLVQKMCKRIKEMLWMHGTVPLSLGYTCLTTDLINSFVMDRNYHYLDSSDWLPYWGQTLRDASELATVSRQVTWMLPILRSFPLSWAEKMNPGLALFFCLASRCRERINEIFEQRTKTAMECTDHSKPIAEVRKHTLFDQVLDSKLPPEDKSEDRLEQEVRSAIGAGTETTSNALTVITFHLLSDPDKLRKLKEELRQLEPNPDAELKLCDLENLPYLSSVVLEGLRLSYGVSTRLQRTSQEPMQYGEYTIPPGTVVSMCSILQHHDETIFPNSHSFVPERWLDLNERKRLEKYMVSFSKGSRRCIGMNLALAEIFITVGTIFHRFDLELHNTTRDDIDVQHDLFIPRPKNMKTIGVQVKARR